MLTVKFMNDKVSVIREVQSIEVFRPSSEIPHVHVVLDGEPSYYYLSKSEGDGFFACAYVMNESGKTIDTLRG